MFINGFKFHTKEYGKKKTTVNSGVCIKGGNNDDDITDYYGVLEEIIELTYSVVSKLKMFLFKCRWFDSRPNIGVKRVHKDYPLIEVNHKKKYLGYDPFVLGHKLHKFISHHILLSTTVVQIGRLSLRQN